MSRFLKHNPFDPFDSIPNVTEDHVRTWMMIEKWNQMVMQHRSVVAVSNTWAEELVLLLKKEYGLSKEEVCPKNGLYNLQLHNFKLRVVRPNQDEGYAVPLMKEVNVVPLSGVSPAEAAACIKDFDDSFTAMEPEIHERFLEQKKEEDALRKAKASRDLLSPMIKSCHERFLAPDRISLDWSPLIDGKVKLTFRRVEECTLDVTKEELIELLSDTARVSEMLKDSLSGASVRASFVPASDFDEFLY